MFYLWSIKYLITLYWLKNVCTYNMFCRLSTWRWLCSGIQVLSGETEILIQCGLSLHSESSSKLFLAEPTGLFVRQAPVLRWWGEESGRLFSLGYCVSLSGAPAGCCCVPHSLFFAPTCDTEARLTTPLCVCMCVSCCVRVCVLRMHARFGRLLLLWQMECSPRPDYQTHIIEIRAVLTVKLSLPLCS